MNRFGWLKVYAVVLGMMWASLFMIVGCQKTVQTVPPSAPSLNTTQDANVQLKSPEAVPQSHTVALSWTWNSSFQNFHIYRSKTSGAGYVLRGTVVKKTYTDTVANATQGEVLYYVVTAIVNGKETPYSNQQQAVMP